MCDIHEGYVGATYEVEPDGRRIADICSVCDDDLCKGHCTNEDCPGGHTQRELDSWQGLTVDASPVPCLKLQGVAA